MTICVYVLFIYFQTLNYVYILSVSSLTPLDFVIKRKFALKTGYNNIKTCLLRIGYLIERGFAKCSSDGSRQARFGQGGNVRGQ